MNGVRTFPWPHGTRTGYNSHACRCEPCKDANREYQRGLVSFLRKVGLPEGDPRHGTINAYRNWGCRCDACRDAMSRVGAMERARRALWAGR